MRPRGATKATLCRSSLSLGKGLETSTSYDYHAGHVILSHEKQRAEFLSHHKVERMRRFVDRIKTILLLDSGWTYDEVAEALFLGDATIRRYFPICLSCQPRHSYDKPDPKAG